MSVEPIPLDRLAQGLALGPHELVSLVGGGGKTTALFALGRQLCGRVVLTTTTKMARDTTDGRTPLFDPTDDELVTELAADSPVLVWRSGDDHKVDGVDPGACDRWFDVADHVVVEADGARRRPLTAPGPFEPVVPTRTTMLVACVGAAALGRVIADACHRPLRVAALAGCSPSERLTPSRLARVLTSARGLAKGRPAGARFAVLVSGVTGAHRPMVDELDHAIAGRAALVPVATFST